MGGREATGIVRRGASSTPTPERTEARLGTGHAVPKKLPGRRATGFNGILDSWTSLPGPAFNLPHPVLRAEERLYDHLENHQDRDEEREPQDASFVVTHGSPSSVPAIAMGRRARRGRA